MQTIRFISLAALMLGLSACKTFQGNFEAKQSIEVLNKKFLQKTKVATVDRGTYQASVSVKSSKATVRLKRDGAGGMADQKFSFDLAIPKHITQKDFQGNFTVDSADNLQNFALQGNVNNEHGESAPYIDYDSCVHHYESRQVCYPRDPKDPHGPHDCHWDEVPVYGSMACEKYRSYGHKNLAMKFIDSQTQLEAATLNGRFQLYSRVHTISCGPCRL